MAGRSEPGEEVFDQMASFVEFRVVFALYLAVGLQDSWAGGGRCWWRRRESNPRPKSLSARRVHALSDSISFASGA